MRLLIRFGLVAVLLGLAVGVLLRAALARRRFALLATLALLPTAAHAVYLLWLAGVARLPRVPVIVFGAAVLVVLVVGVALGRSWAVRRPWLVPLVPLGAAIVYGLAATALLNAGWAATEYSPDAVVGAVYALGSLFVAAALAPFAPRLEPGAGGRPPWRRG